MPATAKPFRLGIDLVAPDTEVIQQHDSQEAAIQAAKDIMKFGFVIQDRSPDLTRHLVTFYPIHRIRAFRIYEADL